jgi:hypothetical protein
MAASGVLGEVLPGQHRFERFASLVEDDGENFFAADGVLRLGSLIADGDQARAVATRWRLSNDDRDRLIEMTKAEVKVVSYMSIREVRRALYRFGAAAFKDWVRLRWAEDPKASNGVQWRALLAMADSWTRPVFPLTGENVMAAGVPQGLWSGVLSEVGVVGRRRVYRRRVFRWRSGEGCRAGDDLVSTVTLRRNSPTLVMAGLDPATQCAHVGARGRFSCSHTFVVSRPCRRAAARWPGQARP